MRAVQCRIWLRCCFLFHAVAFFRPGLSVAIAGPCHWPAYSDLGSYSNSEWETMHFVSLSWTSKKIPFHVIQHYHQCHKTVANGQTLHPFASRFPSRSRGHSIGTATPHKDGSGFDFSAAVWSGTALRVNTASWSSEIDYSNTVPSAPHCAVVMCDTHDSFLDACRRHLRDDTSIARITIYRGMS